MEFVHELHHLDQIKGNFSVSKRDSQAITVIQRAQPITQSIYATVRSFIEQQIMQIGSEAKNKFSISLSKAHVEQCMFRLRHSILIITG